MERKRIIYKPYKIHIWFLPFLTVSTIGAGATFILNCKSQQDFAILLTFILFTVCWCWYFVISCITKLVIDESGVSLNANNHCILFLPWSEIKYAYPAVGIHGHVSFVLSPKSLEKKTIRRLINCSLAISSAKKHGVIIVFFDGFQKNAEEVYEIIVKNVPVS